MIRKRLVTKINVFESMLAIININYIPNVMEKKLISFSTDIEAAQDCGCSAALRYDVFKSRNDFFSEMLLAREINQSNFRELESKAGGNLNIFGLKIGANGENVSRIKEIYNDRMLSHNVSAGMAEYESISTSSLSYDAYRDCMHDCLRKRTAGIEALIVAEDENSVTVDLRYVAAQNSHDLTVSYDFGQQPVTVVLAPNTWAFPAIKIPRVNKSGFPIIFSPQGQYETLVVQVRPYKPITAMIEIDYISEIEVTGKTIALTAITRNNESGEKGNHFEIELGKKVDENINSKIGSLNDGVTIVNDYIFNSEGFKASKVIFKATAPAGYFLRNPQIQCEGSACKGWQEDPRFIVKNETLVIYTEKRYSASCKLNFTVETYKIEKQNKIIGAFSTTDTISLIIPARSTNVIIKHLDDAFLPEESSTHLKYQSTSNSPEGDHIYHYRIV